MTGPALPFQNGHHHLFHRPSFGPRARAIVFGAAVGALVMFTVMDVSLYQNLTAPVQVSAVSWITEGQQLATSAGFTIHTSQVFNLTLRCNGFCYRFNGASVSSPFSLVSTQIYYYPGEFVNITAKAPAAGYNGPLSVTLTVG